MRRIGFIETTTVAMFANDRQVQPRRPPPCRAAALLFACALPAAGPPPDKWAFELFTGSAWNAPTHLTIEQTGQPDIGLTARYDTRPFTESPYDGFRIGRWRGDRAWEFEYLHHKLYLSNPPDEVQRFEITHGFNVFSLTRAFRTRTFDWRVGGGLVVAHPESTVRGLELAEDGGLGGRGYYLSGGQLEGALGKRFPIGASFFLMIEGRLTVAFARVPVEDGHASVPNVALHGNFGAGWEF